MWAVWLRHAASDTALRLYLLMGARGGSPVDVLVVAPGTSSSVRRVLDHYEEHYLGGRKCSNRNTSSYVSGIRTAAILIRYSYCCCVTRRRSPSCFLHLLHLQLLLCCCCSCCCCSASVAAATALVYLVPDVDPVA